MSKHFTTDIGTFTRVNDYLENANELVNEDPWTKAWMIAIKPTDPNATSALLDAASYRKHLSESEH
jgi:glycine cleavage system H protein